MTLAERMRDVERKLREQRKDAYGSTWAEGFHTGLSTGINLIAAALKAAGEEK